MILFHNKLYVAEELSDSRRKVLKKLKQGKLQMGVLVITLPLGDNDMLEIYPSYVLLQEKYKQEQITVVGIAGEQETAFSLIEQMANDCLANNGNADIRAYFEQDMKL